MRSDIESQAELLTPPEFAAYDNGPAFYFKGKEFRKHHKLGEGDFGEVFCFQASDLTRLAVKSELLFDQTYGVGQAFKNEAAWYQKIYGLGEFSGDVNCTSSPHHILMPYFPGKSLLDVTYYNEKFLLSCWIKTASEVHALHQNHRAVHCDLKFDNVIFNGRSFLIDFGYITSINAYRDNIVYDTEENKQYYRQLAPELFTKLSLKQRAHTSQDIYALGILLWDMFSLFLAQHNSALSNYRTREIIHYVKINLTHEIPSLRWPISKAIYMLSVAFFSQISHVLWHARDVNLDHSNSVNDAWHASTLSAILLRTHELETEQQVLQEKKQKSLRKEHKIKGLKQLRSDIQVRPDFFNNRLSDIKLNFPDLTSGIFSQRTKTMLDELTEFATVFH